ncbi:hypothetical protein [Streptomyces sp. NPDC012510]
MSMIPAGVPTSRVQEDAAPDEHTLDAAAARSPAVTGAPTPPGVRP